MVTFSLAAIVLGILILVYAGYKLTVFLRSLFRPAAPRSLMKVGQVAPPHGKTQPASKPEPVVAAQTKSSAAATTAGQTTNETKTATVTPDAPGTPRSPLFHGLHQKRLETAGRLPPVDTKDTPLADGSDYAFGGLTTLFSALLPETDGRRKELKQDLKEAGYYQPHAYENIQATRYLLMMIPLFMLGILIVVVPAQLELWVLGTMSAVAILGWALPQVYVRSQAADRRAQIERSLPDVLDMLNMCVSQGMTLVPGLKRVTSELKTAYPALSQELQIVAEQAELGTLEQALENLNGRVNAPDVHSFTNLLIQTERMGTSISVALSDYAENMRESLRQRADEKANRATFQLLFPTVLCLMPAVYMFLLGPSIIKLTDFFTGQNAYSRANDNFNRQNSLRITPGGTTNN